jgi:catechol 2,3-dioxygenase-like lactoylglutathione lyase family enzyme
VRQPGFPYAYAVHLGLVTVVVTEYDPAISFFVEALGFELVEDSPALTGDGRPGYAGLTSAHRGAGR